MHDSNISPLVKLEQLPKMDFVFNWTFGGTRNAIANIMLNMNYYVFAYGSLIWNPGFDFVSRFPAFALGCRRELCIQSKAHRGTAERPGAVLGLLDDQSSKCYGFVYEVDRKKWPEVSAYLDSLEMHRDVYQKTMVDIEVGGKVIAKAQAFMTNRKSKEFQEELTDEIIVERVAFAKGPSGTSFDYLKNVIESLKQEGVSDARLDYIFARAMELLG
jgi:cation transport protein ChaC